MNRYLEKISLDISITQHADNAGGSLGIGNNVYPMRDASLDKKVIRKVGKAFSLFNKHNNQRVKQYPREGLKPQLNISKKRIELIGASGIKDKHGRHAPIHSLFKKPKDFSPGWENKIVDRLSDFSQKAHGKALDETVKSNYRNALLDSIKHYNYTKKRNKIFLGAGIGAAVVGAGAAAAIHHKKKKST